MSDFPQLHARSQYAPLAGMCRLRALVGAAGACCADPNLWAQVRLAKAAGKAPHVPAMEVQFEGLCGPLVVLARGDDGWRRLRRLASAAGEARRPLPLPDDAGDLAALSGGAGGALDAELAAGGDGSATVSALRRFGRCAVELAPTMAHRAAREVAARHGLSVAAASDASYERRGQAASHAVLRAIAGKRRADRALLTRLDGGEAAWGHLASEDELAREVGTDAVDGARELAAWLGGARLGLGSACMPDLIGPDGTALGVEDQAALLRQRARDGLAARRGVVAEHWSRLEFELGVILSLGYQGYFLTVAEIVSWAKSVGIAVGPGRGSAPGSTVVWALGITALDPVAHGMMFERFMNPERVSYPDIDLDFDKRRREEIVQYLRDRYGEDSVGRIITYKPLSGKTAVKDVGRAFGFSYVELNRVTAGAPNIVNGKPPKVAWLAENLPALRDERYAEVIRHAREIEGCVRESGVHASGVVVSRGSLSDWAPTCRTRAGDLCAQWGWEEVEAAGLVKFDLLGLTTVTHLHLAEEMVNADLRLRGRDEERPGPADARSGGDSAHRGRGTTAAHGEGAGREAAGRDGGEDGAEDRVGEERGHGGAGPGSGRGAGGHGGGLGRDELTSRAAAQAGLPGPDEGGGGGGPGRAGGGAGDGAEPGGGGSGPGGAGGGPAGGRRPVALAGWRLEDLPLDDAATYAAIARGDTLGVFQLGKGGMRRMLQQLRPDCFADVVAACALWRPGPIQGGMVRDYIARKHGREPVKYLHPALEVVTKDTYACLCYQEQIMATCRVMAGYTLGGADLMRRAMHKKRQYEMDEHRVKFADGCVRLGTCDAATADKIFDFMDHFAGYGFNVAHSTVYAAIGYWTAYLKVHHAAQFYAAWLSSLCDESDRFKKIAEAVYDLREHGVEVLPPDVNLSGRDFEPVWGGAPKRAQEAPGGAHPLLALLGPGASAPTPPGASQAPLRVRYGLAALRGLSARAIAGVLAARPFADMADLLRRAPVTKRDLQALVGSGACDAILGGHTRADALASLDALAKWGARERKSLTAPPRRGRMAVEGARDAAARDRVPR